jgi:hypothetical protein
MWELALVLILSFLIIAYYLWKDDDRKQHSEKINHYDPQITRRDNIRRHKIRIGTKRSLIKSHHRNNFNLVRIKIEENAISKNACSVCGRNSHSFGHPISCKNYDCVRWYHPRCLRWTKQNGRLKCSCGSRLP